MIACKKSRWLRWFTVKFSPIIGIFLAYFFLLGRSRNNVCKTFDDYYTDRDNNENCHYNPDYRLEVSDIIERYGYQVKTYEVTTKDGYILKLYRIPPEVTAFSNNKTSQPILLLHGAGLNCECFVNIGKKSLAFILSDAGYDVWLGNFRGTVHSRRHKRLSERDTEFWNYSFHEFGIYDVEAKLNLVYNQSEQQKIVVIGFSVGSTASLIYNSLKPVEAKNKIKVLIALAPVISMKGWWTAKKWILRFVPDYVAPIYESIFGGQVNIREYIPNALRKYVCLPYPIQMHFCQTFDMMAWGFSYSQSDPETLPITILRDSDSLSMKFFLHYIQMFDTFRHYDYSSEHNNKLYGQEDSPHYNLSRVAIPVFILRSDNDGVASKKDVEALYESLPQNSTKMHVIEDKTFNHMDFLLGKDVVPMVYDHILSFLKMFLTADVNDIS